MGENQPWVWHIGVIGICNSLGRLGGAMPTTMKTATPCHTACFCRQAVRQGSALFGSATLPLRNRSPHKGGSLQSSTAPAPRSPATPVTALPPPSIRPTGRAPGGQLQPLRGRRRPPSAHDHLFTGIWIFDLTIYSPDTRYAPPRHGTCGRKGLVPRRGSAPRPSVSLMTPYAPRRFKGPVGSPLIVPLPANKAGRLILVISISL